VTTAVAFDTLSLSLPSISPTIVSEVCAPALLLGVRLRWKQNSGESEPLRQRMQDMLDRIEERLRDAGLAQSDISDVVFALVAFLDESIIRSEWQHKTEWRASPLQFDRFGRDDAGEEFFTRLTAIRAERTVRADVLQIYFLCLTLGFKGKYALLAKNEWESLRVQVGAQLRRLDGREGAALAPHGRAGEELAEVVKEIPLWVFVVAGAAVAFALYLTLAVLIASKLGAVQQLLAR
jgi:type VI secretion system protein ImpK